MRLFSVSRRNLLYRLAILLLISLSCLLSSRLLKDDVYLVQQEIRGDNNSDAVPGSQQVGNAKRIVRLSPRVGPLGGGTAIKITLEISVQAEAEMTKLTTNPGRIVCTFTSFSVLDRSSVNRPIPRSKTARG